MPNEITVEARTRADEECIAHAINTEERTIRFLAQSARLASDNLIILPLAGKKHSKEFMKNPIVVPYHWLADDNSAPIVVGNVIKDEFEVNKGRFQTVKFATSDLAEQWWRLYGIDRAMKMVSIAWYRNGEQRETEPEKMLKILSKHSIPLKEAEKVRLMGVVTEYRQRDLSLVPIGADPDAMAHSINQGNEVARAINDHLAGKPASLVKGVSFVFPAAPNTNVTGTEGGVREGEGQEEPDSGSVFTTGAAENEPNETEHNEPAEGERGVIPYKDLGTAEPNMAWDGPANIKAADVPTLKLICTFYEGKGENKGDYKLPHHSANNKKAVWAGVRAAMAVVFGARGGLKGEAAQNRKAIYSHLAKHYKQFDKTPPEFREENLSPKELVEHFEEVSGVIVLGEHSETNGELIEAMVRALETLAEGGSVEIHSPSGHKVAFNLNKPSPETKAETPNEPESGEHAGGAETGGKAKPKVPNASPSMYGELLDFGRAIAEGKRKRKPSIPTSLLEQAEKLNK